MMSVHFQIEPAVAEEAAVLFLPVLLALGVVVHFGDGLVQVDGGVHLGVVDLVRLLPSWFPRSGSAQCRSSRSCPRTVRSSWAFPGWNCL